MEILPDKIESNKIKEDSTKEYNEKQKNVDKRNRYNKIKNTKKNHLRVVFLYYVLKIYLRTQQSHRRAIIGGFVVYERNIVFKQC